MAMNAYQYMEKGFIDARRREIVAWGACNSWQRKAYKDGYLKGLECLKGEAKLMGWGDDLQGYRRHLIMQVIKG